MQLRCFKCQMPFSLNKETVFAALDVMTDENLNRYDVRCPKCRKINRVPFKQFKRAAPTWKRDREETKSEES